MILRLSLSATHRGEKTIRISVILKYDLAESTKKLLERGQI